MKKIASILPEAARYQIDTILQRSVNVLSLVHPHVYFPTYSSSLKAIASHLGSEHLKLKITGLESIIWRTRWEAERNAEWKAKLEDYNRTDCLLLRKLTKFILDTTAPATAEHENRAQIKRTDEVFKVSTRWPLSQLQA